MSRFVQLCDDIHVDISKVQAVEFKFIEKAPARPSLIVIPENTKRKPRCCLHMASMHVCEFEIPEGVTPEDILVKLEYDPFGD